MIPGEFEQLFTTSLTGIYQDNVLESGFKEFTNMILNPRLAQDRMRKIIIPPPEIERAIERLPTPEVPLDITLPTIPRVSASPSVASDAIFAGYQIDQIEAPIPSVSPQSYVILFIYI